MRTFSIRKFHISVISALLTAAIVIGSGAPATRVEASAAGTVTVDFPSDDLPEVPVPKVSYDKKVVDGFRLRVLNSGYNYNTDVETGPHYEYLNSTEKALYRAFVVAANNVYAYDEDPKTYNDPGLVKIFSGDKTDFKIEDVNYTNALEAAKYDNIDLLTLTLCEPRLLACNVEYTVTDSTTFEAYLFFKCIEKYNYTQAAFEATAVQMRSARSAFLSDPSITGAKGKLGKELAIHDKLMSMITYDYDCYQQNTPFHFGHTAFGPLAARTAVCDGYAMAYRYLLEGIGVESLIVSGNITEGGSGGHAWNIVKQEGEWYEVDITWDDIENLEYSDEVNNQFRHLYYHLTSNGISRHSYEINTSANRYRSGSSARIRTDYSTNLPVANSTKYNYAGVLAYINGIDNAEEDTNSTVTVDVSFDLNGGSGSADKIQATVGQTYGQLPSGIEREGYTFAGWFTGAEEGTEVTSDTEVTDSNDHTLYAHWTRIETPATSLVSDENEGIASSSSENEEANLPAENGTEENTTSENASSEIVTEEDELSENGSEVNVLSEDETEKEAVAEDQSDNSAADQTASESAKQLLNSNDNEEEESDAEPVTEDIEADTTGEEASETQVHTVIQKSATDDAENSSASEHEDEAPAANEEITVTAGSNSYKIDASGEATITVADDKKVKKVNIADTVEYNGTVFKVTEIEEGAYKNCKKLTNVTIGKNVKRIGSGAFSGCEKLKKITIKGDNLKTIGSGSFKNIKKGAKITIICKEKKTYTRLVKKIRKAGAKTAVFKFKKGK